MSNEIIISVIIPFYNELYLIERAINSVTSQSLPIGVKLEVLIGNDSKFTEMEIRAVLSKKSNDITSIYKNILEPGAGNARNIAIDNSIGNIIAFLDADDYWCNEKICNQLSLLKNQVNFVAGAYCFEGASLSILPPRIIKSTYDLLLNTNVGTSTVMIKRELLGKNRFRNYIFSQDTELWARLAGEPNFSYGAYTSLSTIYCRSPRTANKLLQFKYFYKIVRNFPLTTSQTLNILIRYSLRGVCNHYLKHFIKK